jgi:hypothetical protein
VAKRWVQTKKILGKHLKDWIKTTA